MDDRTTILTDAESPFKEMFIVLKDGVGQYYIFSYSHLGKLWMSWSVRVEVL